MFKETLEKANLIERIYWLICLRWFVTGGIFITIFIVSSVFDIVTWAAPLYIIGIILGISNTGFFYYRKVLQTKNYASVQKHAGIQIMLDIFLFTCLIYFTGGVGNPFIIYFLFQAIIAGILLQKKYSYLQALFTITLFALLISLEYYSLIPHQPVKIFSSFALGEQLWQSDEYVMGIFFAIASAIFISVFFVTSIMDRLRKSRDDVLFEIKSTVENMSEGVVFIDNNDKVTMSNKTFEKTWDKKRYLIGRSVKDNIIPYAGVPVSKIIEKFREGIETSHHQEIKTDDGYLYNTYCAVYDNTGKYWGTVLSSHDITERKKLERRLLQAERLATIGEMSAKIAHEIKNPLSSISLNTELLYDEINNSNGNVNKSKDIEEMIQSIMSEVDRLTEISDEYLQYARFPALEPQQGSVNGVLIELAKFLKEEITQRGIVLKEDYGTDLPNIPLDKNQLKQSFLNILKNSFDAMTTNGRLNISTKLKDNNVEVCFSDSGPGISERELQKIFNPFYSTKVNGSGLGLALTQKIIEEHGGDISCTSIMGVGTITKVSFPINGTKENINV